METYAKAQGLWHEAGQSPAEYSEVLEVDLSKIEPSLAGPKRPQDRVPLKSAKSVIARHIASMAAERAQKVEDETRFEDEGGSIATDTHATDGTTGVATVSMDGQTFKLHDGDTVIAAITSCTNTSNPEVMLGAGLLARRARAKGLKPKPWVKTSLAPGSKVVTDYLKKAGLLEDMAALGFNLVGYGCTTCIGNSGPLRPEISEGIRKSDLIASAVLSGNRNFEGRIHPEVKMNFLASPPLVVAYALAGSMHSDLLNAPLGAGKDGKSVYLKDIWPSQKEISDLIAANIDSDMFMNVYGQVFDGDKNWGSLKVPAGQIYHWDKDSTYVRNPQIGRAHV